MNTSRKEPIDTGGHPEAVFRRATRLFSSERAQKIQMRLFALGLFLLSLLLTFNDHVYQFAERFTDRPEILPLTLLVPFVYLIFQVVLWRLERDEDSLEKRLRFDLRRSEIRERRLERRSVVEAFSRSVMELREYDMHGATAAMAEWIASECEPTIEVRMLAYSSETFLDGCLGAANRIRARIEAGKASPKMIVFKILTRDPMAIWRLPFFSIREADEDYRHALNARFDQFLSRWKVEVFEAFAFLPRESIKLEVRWYPFEPMYKGVMVSDSIGLVGVYDVHQVHHKGVSGWDYHGHGARMYEMRVDDEGATEAGLTFRSFREFFDTLWSGESRLAESL